MDSYPKARLGRKRTFLHSRISLGIPSIASLLFSILFDLLAYVQISKCTGSHDSQDANEDANVLCSQHSLVSMTLDFLPDTGTAHLQTVLDPVPYALLGALGREGQQLLDALLAGQLDELGLAPQRELGVVPLAGDGVLVRQERVRRRPVLDRVGPRRRRQDLVRRILGEEPLQTRVHLLRELDEAHICRHRGRGEAIPFARYVSSHPSRNSDSAQSD